VGFIQDIENTLLAKLKGLFSPILKPLQRLWGVLKGFFSALIDLIPATVTLVKGIIEEIQAWRSFKQNVSFKGGVINLQSVHKRVEDLLGEIIDAYHAIVDLTTTSFKFPAKAASEAADALEEVIVTFEDFFGDVGLRAALEKIGSQFSKLGGKVFEVLALVQAVAEGLLKIVNELQTVLNAIKDVRETFQTGEGLFLQQKNKRKILKVVGGGKIKVRLGKFHS